MPDAGGVRLLPALAGLGAPWWEPRARVAITGLSAATRRSHLAQAALDAIAQRTADVVEAMAPALPDDTAALRVDGGLTGSGLLVQRLADLAGRPVDVASDSESTALGTAILAAIGAGRLDEAGAASVARTRAARRTALDDATRRSERAAWRDFIRLGIALAPGRPQDTRAEDTQNRGGATQHVRKPVDRSCPAAGHRPPRPLDRRAREHARGLPHRDRARCRDDRV